MIIDMLVYGSLKALSWILFWIPPLPDWVVAGSYTVFQFVETLTGYAVAVTVFLPMDTLRPIVASGITAVVVLWGVGIVHRLVAWMIPGEQKGQS